MDSVTFLKKDDNEKKVNDKKKFFLVVLGIGDFVYFMFIELKGKQLESNYLSLEKFNFKYFLFFLMK